MSKEEAQSNDISIDDCYLTYWYLLSNQTSSVYDLIDQDSLLDGIDPDQVLVKQKTNKSNLTPYITVNDLNNSKDAPYENKPKPSIEIGLKFEF